MSHKFNVGDALTSKKHGTKNIFTVTSTMGGRYHLSAEGRCCGQHSFAYIESVLELKTAANPNLVEVSSLDYSDSKLLGEDDVAIITKHLNSLENY
jgi:hypothetical protein